MKIETQPKLVNTILSIDATNYNIANANNSRRDYIVIGTNGARTREPLRVAGAGISSNDLRSTIGTKHIDLFQTITLGEERADMQMLIEDVVEGRIDAGITHGEVSVDALKNGVTAFSPLYFNNSGEIRVPKNPITVIAKHPVGR